MAIEKVKEYFDQFGMADRVQELDASSATVELAAQALNCEPGRIAKTLSFMVDGRAILTVMAGDAKIDNSRYKARFGTKAKMLAPDEAETLIPASNEPSAVLARAFGECREGHIPRCSAALQA